MTDGDPVNVVLFSCRSNSKLLIDSLNTSVFPFVLNLPSSSRMAHKLLINFDSRASSKTIWPSIVFGMTAGTLTGILDFAVFYQFKMVISIA